jgi:hypothetical protein
VTITLPRNVLAEIAELSAENIDRMHELLEKNTEGKLSRPERAELKKLVRAAELSEIISMAIATAERP